MISTTLKKYNFFDFDLKFNGKVFSKCELSVLESENVCLTSNSIKPSDGFSNYFETIFSKDELNSPQSSVQIQDAKLVYEYSFYDAASKKYCKRIFLIDTSLNLYEINQEKKTVETLLIQFSNMPRIFENHSKLYFYSDEDKFVMIEQNNKPIFITDFLNILHFSEFQNKLFFAESEDKFTLYFSDELEIENIGSALEMYNYLKLNQNFGKIVAICSFNSALYVIQQYAISKFSIINDNLKISSFFPFEGKIEEGTVFQINDYIVFLSNSGMYMFDGASIKNIFRELSCKICLDKISASSFNEKYYLSTKLAGSDEFFVLEFDIDKNKFNIIKTGTSVKLLPLKNITDYKLLALEEETENGILVLGRQREKTQKFLRFNPMIFDDGISKSISDISIFSSGKFSFKIITDYTEKEIEVQDQVMLKNLGVAGNYFQFEISSEDYFEIYAIMVTVSTTAEKL